MKKWTILLVMAWLCLNFTVTAQVRPAPSKLAVGDTLPEVILRHLSNYSQDSLKLSALRGRWLVVDLWATWCSTCIQQFPHVDELAKQYSGQVTFLLVNSKPLTSDDLTKINYTFSFHPRPKHVIMAAEDMALAPLLPVRSLPCYVWIDPQGVIRAITDQSAMTEARIHEVLLTGRYPAPQPLKTAEP